MSRRAALALGIALLALLPGAARAHGGLPVAEDIFWRGDTMWVPTQYWGVFYGKDGGPWRWICEEAINKDQLRKWALGGDGTWHVTDYAGVTSSRDGGCTWVQSTGEIQTRSTSDVEADPADPARAWATTDAGGAPWNALFTTTDGGVTWTDVLRADEYLRGVAVSADGKRLYVSGTPRSAPPPPDGGAPDAGAPAIVPALHVSRDGGKTWEARALRFVLEGFVVTRLVPVAVDPRDPDVVWLRVETDPTTVLLRGKLAGDGVDLVEVLRKDGTVQRPGIAGLGFRPAKDEVFIAAGDGVYRVAGDGAPVKTSTLSRAQCVSPRGDALYACAWNYSPDNAAIARSDDGAASFRKVFQYAETVAPIDTCAPTTSVGQICPLVWAQYAAQLGISLGGDDGGAGPGVDPATCHCALGSRRAAAAAPAVLLPLVLAALVLAARRRR